MTRMKWVATTPVWAEIFNRELTTEKLFAIQGEIPKAIADALQAELNGRSCGWVEKS